MVFWKRQKEPKVFKVDINSAYPIQLNHSTVHHEHLIKHERPALLYVEFRNQDGMLWKLPAIQLNGQYMVPIYFPLSHYTGKPSHNAIQVELMLRLEDYGKR